LIWREIEVKVATDDPRIAAYTDYVLAMQRLDFDRVDFGDPTDSLGELGQSLADLAVIMDRWHHDQGRLLEITEKINQGIFLADILDYVFDTFRPIIPYGRIGFALLEDDGQVLRAHWARSDIGDLQVKGGYAQRLEDSSLSEILATGEPRVINDLEAYYRDHPHSDSTKKILAEGIRSSLTCPLFALGKPIGFMFFSSTEANTYKHIHQDLFRRIANQLAVIVEKSRLYEDLYRLNQDLLEARSELQHRATHDNLTGLWNRGAILELADKEIARAQRATGAAALIMVDIDHFKGVNDSMGHLVGDHVLREVARRLESVARREDTVGRFGGEEFLIVLSHANAVGAETAAERYREKIASAPIEVGGKSITITASLGVGIAASVDDLAVENLIKRADDALYRAKAAGRDRIELNTV